MGKNKELRKFKQAGRRQARKEIEEYFKTFEEALRPKPFWIPKFLWRLGQRIFIRINRVGG